MSDTFYKPMNTITVRHIFTANDARKVMEKLGFPVREFYKNDKIEELDEAIEAL